MTLTARARRLLRFCWYGAATVIVLFALLVSAVRSLLPELDSIRDDLTQQIQQRSGLVMTMEQLGASWEPKGPQLVIKAFHLPAQQDLNIDIQVQEAVAQLDFWRSLRDLDFRFDRVTFNGVEVHVHGPLTNSGGDSGNAVSAFKNTFLHQLSELNISEGVLYLHLSDNKPEPIHIANLQWRNRGNRHLGEGRLYLDETSNLDETLKLAVELRSAQQQRLFGRGYLQAEQLDIGDWLARQFGNGSRQFRGVLNMQSWLSFDEQGVRGAQIAFGESDFSWQQPQAQRMAIKGGSLVWTPTATGGELSSRDLQLTSNGQPWPETRLALSQQGDDVSLWMNRLPLDKLKPLLGLLPGIKDRTLADLLDANGRGQLADIKLQQRPDGWSASAGLKDLGWDMSGKVPGLSGLNGQFVWHKDHGRLSLPKQDLAFYWPWQFSHTVKFSEVSGELTIDRQQGWLVKTDSLKLDGDILKADLEAALLLPEQGATRLQLYGNAELKQAEMAGRLFPRKAMGEALSDYLSTSLQAGHTDDAQILWHGDFSDYPYDGGQGVFQAGFTLKQGQFQFLPSWPAVTGITLQALFENKRMDLWLKQGLLDQVPVQDAHVFIPTLDSNATLTVLAGVRADAQAATQLMQASSLSASVGATLAQLKIEGPVATSLDLTFPLGAGVEDQSPAILGRVAFWDNPVYLTALSTQLSGLRGELQFNGDQVTATDLGARVFNQPLSISLNTGRSSDTEYRADLQLGGQWQTANIDENNVFPLFSHLEGQARWSGDVGLVFLEGGGYRYDAQINSDLVGLNIDLPAPVGKSASTPYRAVLEVHGDDSGAELQFSEGMRLGYLAQFRIDEQGFHWPNYQLAIGKRPSLYGVEGGSIDLAMSEVELTEWLPLITAFIDTSSDKQASMVPPLTRVHGSISRLDIFGLYFDQTLLEGWPDESGWRFRAESDQLRGDVRIGKQWRQNGIGVIADRLQLLWDGSDDSPQKASADLIAKMPGVSIEVADFSVKDLPLGQLTLTASHTESGYSVDRIELSRPEYQLNASGLWVADGDLTRFDLGGELNSPDFGKLSSVIKQPLGIKSSPLDTQFAVSWQNAPWEPDYASLNGSLGFELGQGHLSEVSDKGARILSLFSLDSLLRKLSLDFTDVFGKGFYYQSFKGDITFTDGVSTTTNTVLDGDAGVMKINGDSDLVSHQLDYRISFSPALTASVPAVALISGASLTVGVGAFAVSKILEPVIEIITQLNFKLTGTFEEPILEELERAKREIRIVEDSPAPETSPKPAPATEAQPQMEALPEPLPDGDGKSVGQ
ncbi:YhdP family protein [Ferrimonas kyonanensis]|uniref:YhdP family protein n=1 Tax=Ferrimonas kyonanensis TaxID=364763 RepID=UPI0004899674|nr:YhdP family protein [Ferrimonas kyonanensis]